MKGLEIYCTNAISASTQVRLQHWLLSHQLQPGVRLRWPFLWQPLPSERGVLSEAGTHRGQALGPLPRSDATSARCQTFIWGKQSSLWAKRRQSASGCSSSHISRLQLFSPHHILEPCTKVIPKIQGAFVAMYNENIWWMVIPPFKYSIFF